MKSFIVLFLICFVAERALCQDPPVADVPQTDGTTATDIIPAPTIVDTPQATLTVDNVGGQNNPSPPDIKLADVSIMGESAGSSLASAAEHQRERIGVLYNRYGSFGQDQELHMKVLNPATVSRAAGAAVAMVKCKDGTTEPTLMMCISKTGIVDPKTQQQPPEEVAPQTDVAQQVPAQPEPAPAQPEPAP